MSSIGPYKNVGTATAAAARYRGERDFAREQLERLKAQKNELSVKLEQANEDQETVAQTMSSKLNGMVATPKRCLGAILIAFIVGVFATAIFGWLVQALGWVFSAELTLGWLLLIVVACWLIWQLNTQRKSDKPNQFVERIRRYQVGFSSSDNQDVSTEASDQGEQKSPHWRDRLMRRLEGNTIRTQGGDGQ